MFVVAITGGRDFYDYPHMKRVLEALHRQRPITEIRNGGMTGADALSSYWAYENKVDTECFGAQWRSLGKRAGPERSREMLKWSECGNCCSWRQDDADLLVAFPGGRGTDAAVRIARGLNIAVLDYRGDKD